MSTRYNDGSHYENHQRAAELHDVAAHAHRSADQQRGKQDHLTGHEHSRQELEHADAAHQRTEHVAATSGHDEIAARAHQLWEARGCQEDRLKRIGSMPPKN
jgi:hypothetical protein